MHPIWTDSVEFSFSAPVPPREYNSIRLTHQSELCGKHKRAELLSRIYL